MTGRVEQGQAGMGHSPQSHIPAMRTVLRDNNNLYPHFQHSERNSIENSKPHFAKYISIIFSITLETSVLMKNIAFDVLAQNII